MAAGGAYNFIVKICEKNTNHREIELDFNELLKVTAQIAKNVFNESEICCTQITPLLKLLAVLIDNKALTNDIHKFANEKFFNRIFDTLYNNNEFVANHCSDAEIEMYVCGLWTLSRFAGNVNCSSQMKLLFQMKPMQQILARSFLFSNKDLIEITLSLAKLFEFPQSKIAQYIVENTGTVVPRMQVSSSSQDIPIHGCPKFQEAKLNAELGKNLNKLISKIEDMSREQVGNIDKVDIMELYENQKIMLNVTIDSLKRNLKRAGDEVADLKYQVGYLTADMADVRNKMVMLSLENNKHRVTNVSLETEIKDFRVQFHEMEKTVSVLEKSKYFSYFVKPIID